MEISNKNKTAADAFVELQELLVSNLDLRFRYSRLYALLDRLCISYSEGMNMDFSNLFSRLYAICRVADIPYHPIDATRRRARTVIHTNAKNVNEARFCSDVAVSAHFIAQISHLDLPLTLSKLPILNEVAMPIRYSAAGQKVRAIITAIEKDTCSFKCTTGQEEYTLECPHLQRTVNVLRIGNPVNLIDLVVDVSNRGTARNVIIEPDYLVDVSTLTATIRPYGDNPANYLLALLSPRVTTRSIMVGNAANDFMDFLVNTHEDITDVAQRNRLYSLALADHFRKHMLDYACAMENLDKAYFDELHTAFEHIADSVSKRFNSRTVNLPLGSVLLEPAFICETLGLRGRLDVMAVDHRSLIELKSGKADEYGGHVRPLQSHVLQMSLYKEILHYNFGLNRDDIRSFLFYSRYPAFFDERSSADAVRDVLQLRNEIVALEDGLRQGKTHDIMDALTPETLNTKGINGRFWNVYLRPNIECITKTFHSASFLERKYVAHFITFIEREKYMGKTSDNRPDSDRGLSRTWLTSVDSKLASGDIIIDLRLTEMRGNDGIDTLMFAMPDIPDFIPNFSHGEMVQLYERQSSRDNVTTKQIVRGTIAELSPRSLTLRLNYKQRNASLFQFNTRYAIEHDGTDGPATTAMRGLFSLLSASPRRRALLLGLRMPEKTAPQPLLGKYQPSIAQIVTDVFCATDYYLLVGPPGTGKTSVALKAMVREFLLRDEKEGTHSLGLLLMAYTNRAVDEICSMLETIDATYVRIGNEQTCNVASRPHLIDKQLGFCRNREEVRRALLAIPIIVGTTSTLGNHLEIFNLRPYMAIVDEASQILEPQILGLLSAHTPDGHSAIRRFVLIGDHKQLPAVVLSPESRTLVKDKDLQNIGLTNLRNSLFQRLHRLCEARGVDGVIGLLNKQGRMHEDICAFVNREFYDNRLSVVPLPHQVAVLHLLHATTPFERFVAGTRMGFIDVRPELPPPNNKANADEAACVARLVHVLLKLYSSNSKALDPTRQIGIIVPFRNQIGMVRKALYGLGIEASQLTIDTVECYQGSQRDIIIFTTTISHSYQLDILSVEQPVGQLLIDRKLNVALTRARSQFFMVGNAGLLSQRDIYARLIAGCSKFTWTGE